MHGRDHMSAPPNEPLLSEEDYGAIEAAVMETARGRWFLAEYARRNRNADTSAVLEAVARLENAMQAERSAGDADRLRFDLAEMASAIRRAKSEIAAIRPDGEGGRIGDATVELDAIVKSTEAATSEILAAAEHLQEIGWTLREAGVEGAACDLIDQRATDIYTACSFQDITGQRTQKVIQVLRYLEDRLSAMIAIWGGAAEIASGLEPEEPIGEPLLAAPELSGEDLGQRDVDRVLAEAESSLLPPPLAIESPDPLRMPSAASLSSPFSPVERPKPRLRASALDGEGATLAETGTGQLGGHRPGGQTGPRQVPVTVADIDGLAYEQKAALFS
jgi:chemotaxis protein CheZ